MDFFFIFRQFRLIFIRYWNYLSRTIEFKRYVNPISNFNCINLESLQQYPTRKFRHLVRVFWSRSTASRCVKFYFIFNLLINLVCRVQINAICYIRSFFLWKCLYCFKFYGFFLYILQSIGEKSENFHQKRYHNKLHLHTIPR